MSIHLQRLRHLLNSLAGFLASLSDPHERGNFGPFQICYDYGISVCGGYPGGFQTRGKNKVYLRPMNLCCDIYVS